MYWLDYALTQENRVSIPGGDGGFTYHQRFQTGSGPNHPDIQWVPGVLSLGVTQPERETNHSPSFTAES
jgi:hypothetical protein